MESSQWQNGNYSTGCVMLAWHLLFCHWLCPCEEQNIDQWEEREQKGWHRKLPLGNLLGFYSYNDANIRLCIGLVMLLKTLYFAATITDLSGQFIVVCSYSVAFSFCMMCALVAVSQSKASIVFTFWLKPLKTTKRASYEQNKVLNSTGKLIKRVLSIANSRKCDFK